MLTNLYGSSFLPTKLFIPGLRERVVNRPRLLNHFDALQFRKLMLVSAPAGYGKTTLLAEWASHFPGPVGWLSLDGDDNEASRFFSYFILALQKIVPGIGANLLEALSIPQPADPYSISKLLVGQLAEQPGAIHLVLDDYHEITNPDIHAALDLFLDYLPPNVHLMIASRADPPLSFARMRARSQVIEIRAPDLAFTPEESTTFIHQLFDLDLDRKELQDLLEKTEGWATGLQLAGLALQARPDHPQAVREFMGEDRNVVDYLTDEVLNLQSPERRDFLLKTSILDQLESSLCDALLLRKGSQEVLEEMERKNLFLISLDNQRRWFRYHGLFRTLLHTVLKNEHPADVPGLHQHAAAWYEENGYIYLAIQHAICAQDFTNIARLIEQHAEFLWSHNDPGLLAQWLDGLPGSLLLTKPRLQIYRAWVAVLNGQLKLGEQRLIAAEKTLRERTQAVQDEVWGMLYTIHGIFFRMNGDNQKAIELSQKATGLLPSDNLNWQAVALITLGIAFNSIGLAHKSSQAFAQAIAFSSIAGNRLTSVVSAAQFARLLIAQGQLRLAARTCNQALEFSSMRGQKGFSQASRAFTSLAQIYREWNQLAQAKEFLDKAIELSRANQNMRNFFEAMLEQARWLNASGEPRQALSLLEQVEFQIREYRLGEFLAEARSIKARLAVYQGDLEAAGQWAARRGMDSLAETDYSLEDEFLTYTRLRLAQGKAQSVMALLDSLDKATIESGRKGRWMEIQVLKAIAFEQTGHPRKAVLAVQHILHDAEREGFVRLFLDEGQPLLPLLERAYHSNAAVTASSRAYLHALIRELAKAPGEPDPADQSSKDMLTPKELDVLRLLAGGSSRVEIAHALVITPHTVDSHIKNIYAKLGAHNRVEAVVAARQHGLIAS